MDTILRFLPALACPIIMGLMMWMMARQGKDKAQVSEQPSQNSDLVSPAGPPIARSTRLTNGIKKAYSLVSCCLNWKVLVGIAIVGAGVWLFVPASLGATLPVLVALLCPISMFLMMRNMNKNGACETQPEQARSTVIIDATPQSTHPTVSVLARTGQPSLQTAAQRKKASVAKLHQEN